MISIISATDDDFYAMPLPFVAYSWFKIGVKSICFIPKNSGKKLDLAKSYCSDWCSFFEFECEPKRTATYSQVSRLFGAALEYENQNEVLITGDSDMCVFGEYFDQLNDGQIHIVGVDLTPDEQFPMCYAAMPVKTWRSVFNITKSYQEHLEDIVNPIEGDNIRGTNWCLDQFLLKRELVKSGFPIVKHNRSNGQNQFAQNRADRDGWHFDPYNIMDAHLPRPLTDEQNFNKVYDLFSIKYPHDDLSWMREYQKKYKELL